LFFFALLFPFLCVAVAAAIVRDAQTGEDWALAAPFGLIVWVPQWWLLTHNRLVRLRHQVTTAKKQISVEVALRHDLVPNLVEVVRGFSEHESSLLQDLATIRSGKDVDAAVRGEPKALQAVRSVLLLHERHPTLKSSALYRDLHERLWAIEEKIAHSRTFYDDVVTEWNDRIAKFPSSLVAMLAGCREAPLFSAECDEKLPPRIT
jgi:LemA protein